MALLASDQLLPRPSHPARVAHPYPISKAARLSADARGVLIPLARPAPPPTALRAAAAAASRRCALRGTRSARRANRQSRRWRRGSAPSRRAGSRARRGAPSARALGWRRARPARGGRPQPSPGTR
eukprot:6746505-Prymnesium_polylepis.4